MMRAGARFAGVLAVWCGVLMAAAGDPYWGRAWLHIGLWILTLLVNLVVMRLMNPGVLDARTRRLRMTAGFEKAMLPLLLPATLAIPIVAGLDAGRFAWAMLPAWTMGAGIVLHVAGDAVMLSALAVNPFAERVIRIQAERDHRVVTTGPYAIVRHPMYTGLILTLAAVPLVLGSGWAILPVGAVALMLIVRTVFEDRMLREGLAGYMDYSAAVRYRLVPGLW